MMWKMANNILDIFVFHEAVNYWSTYRARQYSIKENDGSLLQIVSFICIVPKLIKN